MSYRVRKQAFTGKLILQHDMVLDDRTGVVVWSDAQAMPGNFEIHPQGTANEIHALRTRVSKYERRAAAARARRKVVVVDHGDHARLEVVSATSGEQQ